MTNIADYSALRRNVSFLGRLLGDTIAEAEGPEVLELVETIRGLSKAARDGDEASGGELLRLLTSLEHQQLVPVARAFSQFLNLANIADQYHTMSRATDPLFSASETLNACIKDLKDAGVSNEQIVTTVAELKIELVLTAHPTEITRRTLIHKHGEINNCLSQLELTGHTDRELTALHARLRELIAQVWYGYDFRQTRPTPVDEARWGLAVVEESLWQAVPEFLRRLERTLQEQCGQGLPLDCAPVKFLSWMGGDRDGNPNVTATVTREVMLLSRWQAIDLYLRDIQELIDELSMTVCDQNLRLLAGDAQEPYRAVLRDLRSLLQNALTEIERQLIDQNKAAEIGLHQQEQLWAPLKSCYDSMLACGMHQIANGRLLDVLRRVQCFDIYLLQHDIRQDSSRHTDALSELTQWLRLGDYAQWDENQRTEFLLEELDNPRPLWSSNWTPSDDVKEVLDTFATVAQQPADALGAYIISMARRPSDILAVHLLLKKSGCTGNLPVTPLFETLADLDNAYETVSTLFNLPWYKNHIEGRLIVMIGYSDSAKDAGVIAASWAQYRAQESLLSLCEEADVRLTLFHGRGGTIGRGGAPAQAALQSQPPGSLRNGFRVTEQGEMIRTKLGLTSLAVKTLALYTSAICRANVITPPTPDKTWRQAMDQLSELSCASYRELVRDNDEFVRYFRLATPEPELAKLTLGSRPARRGGGGGIKSLRAIPWIFAWTQNRLMLPAWLGAGAALQKMVDDGHLQQLREMSDNWPFFATRLNMLEMVYAKADGELSAYYDARLVPEELQNIGNELRTQLEQDAKTVLTLEQKNVLLEDESWLKESIQLRNVYTDPLNVLQVELLRRQREKSDPALDEAVMVTIAGIAAGMRNTG